jgi:hypothetical protein
MDLSRFDALTKTLGAAGSRRRVLGGLAAGLLGAAASVAGAAAKGDTHAKGGKGNNGTGKRGTGKRGVQPSVAETCIAGGPNVCDPGFCCAAATGQFGRCMRNTDQVCGGAASHGTCVTCQTGVECVDGACVCDATSCPNGCCITDQDGNLYCIPNGTTQPGTPTKSTCAVGGGACPALGSCSGCCTANGTCSTANDTANCGKSGLCQACPNGTCDANGVCSTCNADNCAAGCCKDGVCTPPSDAACGLNGFLCHACQPGYQCALSGSDAGACVVAPPCGSGLTRCGDACVNLQTDRSNCGSCGNQCRGKKRRCRDGKCHK